MSREDEILHLLQKVPEERPASASAVLEALERVDPEAASASHSDSGANPLDRLAQGVFVGRQAELERLRSAFDRAFAGNGNIAMLVGEPGSGKTRTSMELETYARMHGAQVLVGRTHESEGMPSYWPWREVGDQNTRTMPPPELAGELEPAQVSELARIFPPLLDIEGVQPPAQITDPESAQFRFFDAYTAFMRAASERKPLMIVLDDLHWADKPSLFLLQHLARSLSRMRVLVVGTSATPISPARARSPRRSRRSIARGASSASDGSRAAYDTRGGSLSGDGNFVGFGSESSIFDPNDDNDVDDSFLARNPHLR